jgi:hypothetical protein
LNRIPEDAAVSASSPLVPHLAFRQKIYQYPDTADANYIVLLIQEEPYPLKKAELEEQVKKLKDSQSWLLLHERDQLLIFKKINL